MTRAAFLLLLPVAMLAGEPHARGGSALPRAVGPSGGVRARLSRGLRELSSRLRSPKARRVTARGLVGAPARPRIDRATRRSIRTRLSRLYGPRRAEVVARQIEDLIGEFQQRYGSLPARRPLSEKDAILIAYPDQVRSSGTSPLGALDRFLKAEVGSAVSMVHVLPFYPSSSDGGFSVIDDLAVAREHGTWQDLSRLSGSYDLMFDAVLNHFSAESRQFKGFLAGDPRFQDYAIEVDDPQKYSRSVRPRTSPLVHEFIDAAGKRRKVITTFSRDQVDRNFKNPQVLLDAVHAAMEYSARGARVIRLDAIAYLWKEPGRKNINLRQTHEFVKLLRTVLDQVAPGTKIITETNVPHRQNVSYFGEGDEAHMVYQFSLPPLVLHTLQTGDSRALQTWGRRLRQRKGTTFFNFLASHDGIGVRPAEGLLSSKQIADMVARTRERGGQVGYYSANGTQKPYELNATYFDAVTSPEASDQVRIDQFMASQSALLALAGVPGIYFHSLLGSSNDTRRFEATGQARDLNRSKPSLSRLERRLRAPTSRARVILSTYRRWLEIRQRQPAFHPDAAQKILATKPELLAILRTAETGEQSILAVTNVSSAPQEIEIEARELGAAPGARLTELLGGIPAQVARDGTLRLRLEPYQVAWVSRR